MVVTRVRRLAHKLASAGFELNGQMRLRRSRPHLKQYIEFQLGTGGLAGQFTCSIGWEIEADGLEHNSSYSFRERLGVFERGTDVWFSHATKEQADTEFEQIETWIRQYAIPLLDSLDLETLVAKYEAEVGRDSDWDAFSPLRYFGASDCWKEYNLGWAYKVLGRHKEAREHLQRVVDEYSHDPYEFVQERRKKCLQGLEELA